MKPLKLENEVPSPFKKGRARRIEDFGIVFIDGFCEGWAFEVPECFRSSLDIVLSSYVSKQPSKERGKVFSEVWTRGNPPLRSFTTGDVFYDPPGVRNVVWKEALRVLRRSIQIVGSKADAEDGSDGWVKIQLTEYANGRASNVTVLTISQSDLETLLRTGRVPTHSLPQM